MKVQRCAAHTLAVRHHPEDDERKALSQGERLRDRASATAGEESRTASPEGPRRSFGAGAVGRFTGDTRVTRGDTIAPVTSYREPVLCTSRCAECTSPHAMASRDRSPDSCPPLSACGARLFCSSWRVRGYHSLIGFAQSRRYGGMWLCVSGTDIMALPGETSQKMFMAPPCCVPTNEVQ
jgi:hypothetical protein